MGACEMNIEDGFDRIGGNYKYAALEIGYSKADVWNCFCAEHKITAAAKKEIIDAMNKRFDECMEADTSATGSGGYVKVGGKWIRKDIITDALDKGLDPENVEEVEYDKGAFKHRETEKGGMLTSPIVLVALAIGVLAFFLFGKRG